ncbi:MAG: MoaD/ThiS family protein [Desulfurococcaceae archaeon]
MKLTVRYAGLLTELTGKYQENLDVQQGITLKDLIELLVSRYTALRLWLERIPLLVVHVNGVNVTGYLETVLKDNDVVEISTPLYEGG